MADDIVAAFYACWSSRSGSGSSECRGTPGDASASRSSARRLEERALNASGAFQSLVYDGWLLGYRPGPTKRLRCVNPFYPSTLPIAEKVAWCSAFYAAANLPLIFRLLPFSEPTSLDALARTQRLGCPSSAPWCSRRRWRIVPRPPFRRTRPRSSMHSRGSTLTARLLDADEEALLRIRRANGKLPPAASRCAHPARRRGRRLRVAEARRRARGTVCRAHGQSVARARARPHDCRSTARRSAPPWRRRPHTCKSPPITRRRSRCTRISVSSMSTTTGIVVGRPSNGRREFTAMRIDEDLFALAQAVGRAALARRVRIASAESCTGGLVAGAITAVPGSSDWFECGYVTYSNAAKIRQLAVARGYARALRRGQQRDRAGDGAGRAGCERRAMEPSRSPGSPVRRAAALTSRSGPSASPGRDRRDAEASNALLPGDRAAIRRESVRVALQGLLDRLA